MIINVFRRRQDSVPIIASLLIGTEPKSLIRSTEQNSETTKSITNLAGFWEATYMAKSTAGVSLADFAFCTDGMRGTTQQLSHIFSCFCGLASLFRPNSEMTRFEYRTGDARLNVKWELGRLSLDVEVKSVMDKEKDLDNEVLDVEVKSNENDLENEVLDVEVKSAMDNETTTDEMSAVDLENTITMGHDIPVEEVKSESALNQTKTTLESEYPKPEDSLHSAADCPLQCSLGIAIKMTLVQSQRNAIGLRRRSVCDATLVCVLYSNILMIISVFRHRQDSVVPIIASLLTGQIGTEPKSLIRSTEQNSETTKSIQHLAGFWEAIYMAKSTAGVSLADFAFWTDAMRGTIQQMSYIFACFCGLASLFRPNSEMTRFEYQPGDARLNVKSFFQCDLQLLNRLSAWHFIHMYDEGHIEPTINPCMRLFCLNATDRLQYLREMTSSRSVHWLEEARWFTIDALRECSSLTLAQAVGVVFADMCLLLVLLETSPSANADRLRWYVVCLALLHLGQAHNSDAKFQTMHTLLAFQAVRCVALDHSSIDHVQRLTSCFHKSSDGILAGWERFANTLNLPSEVVMLAVNENFFVKNSLVNLDLWPLFLNPVMLAGEKWADVKDRIPFKGYDLHPSIANSRFPSRTNLFCDVKAEDLVYRLTKLASCKAPATATALDEPTTKNSPVIQALYTVSLEQLAPDQRRDAVRRLGTLRQSVTRHPGLHSPLPTGGWIEPVLDLVRQKLALHLSEALTAADFTGDIQGTVDAFSDLHEGNIPVTHPNRWLMIANVMCFCQHGCHNERLRIWLASLMGMWIAGCPKDPHSFAAKLEECQALMNEPFNLVEELHNYESVHLRSPSRRLSASRLLGASMSPTNPTDRKERLLARMRLKLTTQEEASAAKLQKREQQETAVKNTTPVNTAPAVKNAAPTKTALAVLTAKPRYETRHIRNKPRHLMLLHVPEDIPIAPARKLLSPGLTRTGAIREEASTVIVSDVEIGRVDVLMQA
ncbi:MAG: hypothetical protein KVP17_004347 [Porospora cf. gigantea B]|uniref:uncharacterized protein n=1 Tax=Porospora cf. gigantea B TaxID=2853592 RepID=UPI003571EE12|nr:MAG: hypothetical protein KVP17_004347 [Porospora cf. gigantea B]